jgi:hypothetical protein
MQYFIPLLSGAFGAGIFSFIQFLISRKDKKKEAESAERKALRYIMLYIIQERGKEMLSEGKASIEEKRSLRQWHDVYHNGLGGNGDADKLMEAVDTLPLDLD